MEVVTKGPVAMAASISKRLNMSGMIVPRVADMTIQKKIEIPTTTPSSGGSAKPK